MPWHKVAANVRQIIMTMFPTSAGESHHILCLDTPFSNREVRRCIQLLRGGRASRAAMAHATGRARKIRIAVE